MAEPVPIRKRRRVPGTPLTEMQLAILALLANGFTQQQTAHQLHTTPKLISRIGNEASRRLGGRTLMHGVVLADRRGLLPGSQLSILNADLERTQP